MPVARPVSQGGWSKMPDGPNRSILAARAALVAALRRRLPELERHITGTMRQSVPAYAALAVDEQQRLSAGVARTVELVLDLWAERRRHLSDTERSRVRQVGADRSHMDLRLADVVAGVDMAREAGWAVAVAELERLLLGRLDVPLRLIDAVELMGALAGELARAVDLIREEMSTGYLEADDAARAGRVALYGDVLRGECPTEEEALRRARAAGIDLRTAIGLLLVSPMPREAGSPAVDLAAALLAQIPRGFVIRNPASAISHVVVGGLVKDRHAWQERFGADRLAAMGGTVVAIEPTAGALSLRSAYLDGLADLRLALARLSPDGRVQNRHAVALARLLNSASTDLQEELLRPIRSLQALANAGELLDTLAALVRHRGMPTPASTELSAHRHTVVTRMRQIEARTGLRFADPDDYLILATGHLLRRLRSHSVE